MGVHPKSMGWFEASLPPISPKWGTGLVFEGGFLVHPWSGSGDFAA